MIYSHFSQVPKELWRWDNFSFKGDPYLACPHCGEFYLDFHAMDCLQTARRMFGKPLHINSGHRCWLYNASPKIGGAPNSQHKKIAFDVSINGYDRYQLLSALHLGGFTSFGFYISFIHADTMPGRLWYGKGAKKLWNLETLSEVLSQQVPAESLE